MFTPDKMERVHVLFSEKDEDTVAEGVVRMGSLQVIDSADIGDWAANLGTPAVVSESADMRIRRERIEALIENLNLKQDLDGVKPYEGPWSELDTRIVEIEEILNREVSRRDGFEAEISRMIDLKTRVAEIPEIGLPLEGPESVSYLLVETGRVMNESLDTLRARLKPLLHVLSPMGVFGGWTRVLLLALRTDEEVVRSVLKEVGFIPLEIGEEPVEVSEETLRGLDEKIGELKERLGESERKFERMGRDEGAFLLGAMARIRRDLLIQKIKGFFRKTERTCLLSGWIPAESREAFVREMRRLTRDRCIVERIPAEKVAAVREGKVQVPVRLKNPPFFRPFELITSAYGMPSYRTIDPTPVLGISFLLMFGMMFGDVGHGLVLAIIGMLMGLKTKRSMQKSTGLLLFYAGCASIVFGILFGSLFGLEHILPAVWLRPMERITTLFRIAIYFGIGMITVAIAINIINGIRRRDFWGVIFDKAGLLAAIVYWCSIVLVTRMLTSPSDSGGRAHPAWMLVLLVAVILLFLREPIVHLVQRKRRLFPEGVATGVMGGIVELLEIFLGFLANTVSFIRVAAFGLAHAGLFMAIFALSDAVRGMAGGIVSGLVLVFGNILIIGLEGLVVTIQAVRLEFYEFFGRFFESGSEGYQPMRV